MKVKDVRSLDLCFYEHRYNLYHKAFYSNQKFDLLKTITSRHNQKQSLYSQKKNIDSIIATEF